uniref:Polyhomeotic-like protein 2 n=2 Tax=Sinocyclocheilus grahami TaxID=75366 RepID=A0A672QZR2_SINGR
MGNSSDWILRRVWQRGGRGSKVRHRGGTMEGEQSTPASSASSSTGTSTSTTNSTGTSIASTVSSSSSSTSSGRAAVPQISVYSGIPDRQTVQVIQQALHRQPSTAAQYLQQMYAAQQQHLMLQTAALQQQHLSTAQLQSLAAVQQASLAAGRQNQNGTSSTQSGPSQTTINLTTSPAAAQLISRAQSVNSTPSGISQQAVLLGNASSSTLTASQAQMYLRAQMVSIPSSHTPSVQSVSVGSTCYVHVFPAVPSVGLSVCLWFLLPAYAQIQPQALIKQQPQQFVIQPQAPPTSRTQSQLLQTVSVQPHQQTASLAIQSSAQTSSVAGIIPVLPKPALHNQGSAQNQQATIFHSTVSHHALSQHGSHTGLAHAKAQPVQLTAINLQIQPAQRQASRLAQDDKEKPTSLVVREICPPVHIQPTTTTQGTDPPEQSKIDTVNATSQTQGSVETARDPTGAPVTPTMTSEAPSEAPPAAVTGSVAQNGENKPPQAIVKPHVLTHVIEGFVIQEGAEPFPVERPPVQADSPKKPDTQLPSDPEKTASSNSLSATNSDMEEAGQQDTRTQEEPDEPKLTCELCGWVDFAYKFKRSKRFCSMVCAKRYSVSCTKRVGLFHPDRTKTTNQINQWRRRRSHSPRGREAKKQRLSVPQQSQGESISSPLQSQPSQGESSPCSDISSYEEATSPLSAASSGPIVSQGGLAANDPEELPLLSQHFLPIDPTKWNVHEVFEFIRSLPGCQEIADEFRAQEIDGQAMLLLKEDHLMSAMNIKLGPALKVFARINMLKDSKP